MENSENKQKIKLRDNTMSEPEMVENALAHLMQASGFLTHAGYKETATSLMQFAYKAMETLSEATGDLKLVDNKLSKDEYDKILNDILTMEV